MLKHTLYTKTSKGGVQQWSIWAEGADIVTEYGLMEGKLQTARKTATGKNIGRSNETTPDEQALLEITSQVAKKRDKDYHDSPEEALTSRAILPMLAKDWFKFGDNKKNSAVDLFFVDYKIDGYCCLAHWDGQKVTLRSRGNKVYSIEHIERDLTTFFTSTVGDSECILHGEIYVHGLNFQQISSAIKKANDDTPSLQLHVYDVVQEDKVYRERRKWLETQDKSDWYISPEQRSIVLTESTLLPREEFEAFHDKAVAQGYEGIMIRHPELPYKLDWRTNMLLKYKVFDDSEFTVVGFTNGVGKFADMVIWICEMDDGSDNKFNVVPKGNEAQRKAWYADGDSFVGKTLTVRYFGRSEDNIPRFPVGHGFRLDEDMA